MEGDVIRKQTISRAELRDRRLAVIAEVSTTGLDVTVTLRGKPYVSCPSSTGSETQT